MITDTTGLHKTSQLSNKEQPTLWEQGHALLMKTPVVSRIPGFNAYFVTVLSLLFALS